MPTSGGQTKCPACGSDDVARLKSIHEHGSGRIVGSSLGIDGNNLTVASLSGRTMTAAAQRAAPPEKRDNGWPVAGVVLTVAAWAIMAVVLWPPEHLESADMQPGARAVWFATLAVIGLTVLGLSAATWRGNSRYNGREWATLNAAWLKRWACRRCGEVFTPGAKSTMPGGRIAVDPDPPALVARRPTGPIRYRVEGVDRASKMDTVWHCTASSEANARAKAELEGIVVTAVEVDED